MTHPLDGARLKLARADEHLQGLKAEMDTLNQKGANRRAVDVNFDGTWYEVLYEPPGEPAPARWSAIVGDAVNNMRAALDYTICELVWKTGKEPTTRNAFPIHYNDGKYHAKVIAPSDKRRSPLYRVPPGDAWTFVKDAQPFNAPDFRFDELFTLWLLSNRDKHRALAIQMSFVNRDRLPDLIHWNPDAILLERDDSPIGPLPEKGRTRLFRLRFDPNGPDPGVYVKGQLAIAPTFGGPAHKKPFALQAPYGFLPDIRTRVSEVIDTFEPLF